MAEILFVVKSFLVTCFVVFCLQFKMGQQTLDEKLNEFLQKGALTHFIKDVATGATRLTASTFNAVKEGQIRNPLTAAEEAKRAKEEYENAQKEVLKKLEDLESD